MRFHLSALLILLAISFCQAAETFEELLQSARSALAGGDPDKALALAGKAIAADPKNAAAYLLRASIYEALDRRQEALADLDKTIALDPQPETYNQRGSVRFKLGQAAAAIDDFDKYLERRPQEKPGHWRRGIAYYYAGRFDEGRKQFEGYEKVDTNDVENAVWHYLCVARARGIDQGRKSILKIGRDRRIPMMQVYALYAGQAKPEDVLAAVKEGNPAADQLNQRLFYAHLYLGLYCETAGNNRQAQEHMAKAVEHKIGHYMWDVARVHLELRRQEAEKK